MATRRGDEGGGRHPTPEAIIKDEKLSREEKRRLLARWRDEAGSREGSSDAETNLATRIGRALAFLDEETGERKTTHDQGFYTAISDIGTEPDAGGKERGR